MAATADRLDVDHRWVRVAIDYAALHPEEIERRLRENEAALERAQALAEARAALLAG